MKIFITGGAGFVGSHLTRKLVEEGHEVTIGGLNPEDSVLELPDEVEREEIDVTDPDTLDFSDYNSVIHLVALSPLREPPVPYQEVHVEGTRNVLIEVGESGVGKFFHMSALGADPEGNTEYLRTKGKAQEIVENSNTDYRIFRPSVMFGEEGEFLNFIDQFTTPVFTLQPGRETLFQPLYVEDTAEMIVRSLKDRYSRQVFEIGGPEKLSLGEIVRKLERSKGKHTRVAKLPDSIFRLGMEVSERVTFSPFGMDQYRSLQENNTVDENDAEEFGMEDELVSLDKYLERR